MKKKTVKQLKKILDSVASEYFRKRDLSICYTCGKALPYKQSQCGHFEGRGSLYLRYDEINNHCQCYVCNILKKGNYIVYTLNMIRDYGMETVERLHREKNNIVKWTTLDYERMIEEFKQKIKDLHYEE